MRVLVLGASGLLGMALTQALERVGAEVIGTAYSNKTVGLVHLDIRDKAAVSSCIASAKPDVVVWAINPPGGVDYCELHPDEAHSINTRGTQNVIETASSMNPLMVYFSTDYIFDGLRGPYSETDTPRPINVYGKTKLDAEQAIRGSQLRHLIIRTTAIFGWNRTSRNFAMQVWEHLQRMESLKAAQDQICNPTLVEYLAEVSVRLIQENTQGVVNIVGRDRISRADLGKALARAMALDANLVVPVPTSGLGQQAIRPLQAGLHTKKLEQLLGTEAMDLTEALKRFRRQWRADTHVAHGPATATSEAESLKQEILQKVRRYYQIAHKVNPFVPYKTRVQYAGRVFGEEEMTNLVDSSLDFWLTLGPYGELFEQRMKRFFSARDFLLVNSGSTANLTAIMALLSPQLESPLKPGDEVITPAVTFPTTLAPIVHSGLIPVFVDCELGTYNADPGLLEKAISGKTRAIMIPHTLGVPCDMEVITYLVRRHELYLIEDSCDALGGTFNGKLLGTFGDLATLSFFPAHQMTMGEGGGVVINNPRLARCSRSVRDWGRDCWCAPGESNTCGRRFGWQLGTLPRGYDHKFTYSNLGYNFKPTDMQAAIGVAQLNRLPDFINRRRKNFERLYSGLEPFQDYLVLPTRDPRSNPAWFGFCITVKNGISRHALVQWLENANIETRELFGGNILRQPGYMTIPHRITGQLEQTDRVMRDTFFIGVYPGLSDEMLDFVIARFEEFFAKRLHQT